MPPHPLNDHPVHLPPPKTKSKLSQHPRALYPKEIINTTNKGIGQRDTGQGGGGGAGGKEGEGGVGQGEELFD